MTMTHIQSRPTTQAPPQATQSRGTHMDRHNTCTNIVTPSSSSSTKTDKIHQKRHFFAISTYIPKRRTYIGNPYIPQKPPKTRKNPHFPIPPTPRFPRNSPVSKPTKIAQICTFSAKIAHNDTTFSPNFDQLLRSGPLRIDSVCS